MSHIERAFDKSKMDHAAKQRVQQQNHRNQLKLQQNFKSTKRHHEAEEQHNLELIASASPASSSSVAVAFDALTPILALLSSVMPPSQSQKKRCMEHVSNVTNSTPFDQLERHRQARLAMEQDH